MKIQRKKKSQNSIPFISLSDIMMTVLLFFILTSGASQNNEDHFINIKHKSIVKDKKIKSFEVMIEKNGTLMVDKKKILKTQLKEILKKEGCNNVVMKVDRQTPIIFVVEVMNIASELGLSTSLSEKK